MQDACLGPLLCWLKKTSWSGRAAIRRSLPGLSRPHPRLHRHHRHPLPARKAPRPRRKAERSSVRPLPSPQVRFPPSVCGKRTILRQGQYPENRSSRAMRPRHSFLLRWRRFINAPGQVLPGPSPGRAGHRTPGVPASLSERVPVVPQIPLLRNSSTDKAEMFLKDGKRPISLAPFSPTIRQ